MDCRHAIAVMHERLSGASEAGGTELDSHLVECGRCRAHYRALLELARLATRIEPLAPPASLRRRVSEALAGTPVVVRTDRRWFAVAFAVLACAALAFAIACRPVWQGWASDAGAQVTAAKTVLADAGAAMQAAVDGLNSRIGIDWTTAVWAVRARIGATLWPVGAVALGLLMLMAANVMLIRLAGRVRAAQA